MIDVICCSPMEIFTSAIRPLMRGDDRRDLLLSDGNLYFRHQAADAHLIDAPNQLIAPADAARRVRTLRSGFASGAEEQAVDLALWNQVMASGRSYAAQFSLINPLLDGWETDAELKGGIARLQQPFLPGCWRSGFVHSGNRTANAGHGQRRESFARRISVAFVRHIHHKEY
jgi:hypothetical protein